MKKKIFPNGILKSGAATFVKGLVRTASGLSTVKATLQGAIGAGAVVVHGIKQRNEKNKASEAGGKGRRDWAEIAGIITGAAVLLGTLYMLLSGQISIDEFNEANQ